MFRACLVRHFIALHVIGAVWSCTSAEGEREHSLWVAQAPGASAPAAGGGNQAAGSLNEAGDDVLAEVSFDGGFRVPGRIYNRLFDYQKTGKMHCLSLTPMLHDKLCCADRAYMLMRQRPAKCPHVQPCPLSID